ncbi:PREDICTED: protein hunchback isoform X2 [Dufourea novaeangliae]|uniref:protein hunchback isoform X2 n=1 Tax=Dufourea novaeangliae TaxID=178035 RepID=UPI000767B57D|nr:PREDICTED: protein hunchback isoform X2 [Dufourea novaeangliae]
MSDKMRGNWDTAEPLVHAPNQQLQQQQQTIVEEQRHPLHSATTPAWGITDRIVKVEPIEDKNNDSGVSPDHYTSNSVSPRSRRSSSTANCSLSPGSATSQDSNNMQCSTFDYSPQRMFKTCGSPLEFTRHHSMDEHQSEQTMDVVSSTVKPSNEDVELGQDILQCPICAFSTVNRLHFTEHLATHCTTKCEMPEFVKSVLGQLTASGSIQDDNRSSPTQGERSEHESEEADEPGLRVPRVNSQGKVKTFRCKQCNFVAITKLEFWEHSRGHIRAEKLLTCPKCPFVTEYKHHLEYHLRNHFGSKPFKCDKCAYSCVNKSMLNSHLKSHSNIYQYRCANCSYATKYCHSLKLHLRKYSHQPAMVLNADGSPNPLPIIDVYGTRRGPKQKPMKSDVEASPNGNVAINNNSQTPTSYPPMVVTPQISPVSHHLPMNLMNGLNEMNGVSQPVNGLNGVAQNQSMMTFPFNQLFGGFPMGNFPAFEDTTAEKQLDRLKSTALIDYMKTIDGERIKEEFPQDLAVRYLGTTRTPNDTVNGLSNNDVPKITEILSTPTLPTSQESRPETKVIPLDLSKPNATSNVPNRPITNSPKATGTSRRKGRAVKLDRRVVEEDTDEEQQQQQQQQQEQQQQQQQKYEEQEDMFEPPAASSPGSRDCNGDRAFGVSNEFTCQYCEIAFGNVVMYTVHMGYHGYKDPYRCNMCGHQCTDKVSFFLHIARSKHA